MDWDIKRSSARIDLWGIGVLRGSGAQRIDLCEECYQKFIDFLENGKG